MKIKEVLEQAEGFFKTKAIHSPRKQVNFLLSLVLDCSAAEVPFSQEKEFDFDFSTWQKMLERFVAGEPWQYIMGQVDFYGCKIHVDKRVLIPRQETEILVDIIVQELRGKNLKDAVLWDICCGSGCIGIALKKRFPELKVTVADIDPSALEVAQINAHLNAVSIGCCLSDLFNSLKRQANYLVCNPPYVAEGEFAQLEKEVRLYEPKIALLGGKRGLDFYERLARELPDYLNAHGSAWFEMGRGQDEPIVRMFEELNWVKNYKTMKDYAGINRFFYLEKE